MPPAWSKEQLNIWGFVLGAISIIQDYIKQVVVNDGVPENLKKGEEEASQKALEQNFLKVFEMLASIQERLAALEPKAWWQDLVDLKTYEYFIRICVPL